MTDIQELARREIRQRDWSAMHIAGDRNPPIVLQPRRWLASGLGVRRERGGWAR